MLRVGALRVYLVATLAFGSVLAGTSLAKAEEVSATGKGITGGALLGGEVVMLTEAALGTRPAWAYVVGGVAGAAGGGVGGYFAEQNADPKVSLYLLAGGMALAIPTTVAILHTTAYKPPVDYTQDAPPADQPPADPPQPDGQLAPSSGAPQTLHSVPSDEAPTLYVSLPPASLVGLGRGTLSLSVPAVEVREVFSARERHMFSAGHETEIHLPVFAATF